MLSQERGVRKTKGGKCQSMQVFKNFFILFIELLTIEK